MRVYALLLGITLTAGYGYTADVAVSSLGPARRVLAAPTAGYLRANVPDPVWYGGVLAPVIVESDGAAPAKAGVLSRHTLRCMEATRSRFRAVS